jgi:hypothetical protein
LSDEPCAAARMIGTAHAVLSAALSAMKAL